MSNILITGGAGFIGRQLTDLAREAGHHVTILDNLSAQVHGPEASFGPAEGVVFNRGDLNQRENIRASLRSIETIVHLAAETGTGQSMYEIDRYYRTNVQGTALLFDVLANEDHSVSKLILASSRSVYGEGAYVCRSCDPHGRRCFPEARSARQLEAQEWTPRCPDCGSEVDAVATREDDRLRPASIYAASKLAQEDLVRVGCEALRIGHSILRFQNVYGEGQSLANPYTGVLSIFSTRIRLGLPLPIFEDGRESRDFIHVEDAARALLNCVDNPETTGLTMNVGTGMPTPLLRVAELLCEAMESTVRPHVTGQFRVGDIRHNYADIGRLLSVSRPPAIDLESGLRRFCQWVSSQPIPQDLLDQANAELSSRGLMG